MINGLRFIIGNGCNYNCFFCHHEGYTKNSNKVYNLENLKKIYEFAKKNNIQDISITGGEPFVYWDKLKYLLYYFGNGNFKITLNTNLIFADKYIEELKEIPNIEYHVNFSSTKSTTHQKIINSNYFKKLNDNLKLFKNANLKVCLNIPVLKSINSSELIDIINYSNKMGFFARFLVLLPTKDQYKDYYLDVDGIMDIIPGSKLIRKYSYGRYDITSSLGDYEIVKCLCINHECELCKRTTYIHLTPDLNMRLCMESEEEYKIDFTDINTVKNSFENASRRLKE